jgi:dihydropyrimidinase
MSILIKNGRVVTATVDFLADVFIEEEKIMKIGSNINLSASTVIDATNKYVIPGGIDVHTHIDMPYGNIKSTDDFEIGTIAAAFGGTTTIIDFAVQSKGRSLLNALNIWKQKADGKAVIDYGFHIIITDVNEKILAELDEVVNEGVTSFKLFTAYPGRLMLDDSEIFRVMQRAKRNGALIMMHAENGYEIENLIQQALAEGNTDPIYHALTRPPALEGEATNRTIALAKVADVPVYIVHVTCREAIDAIKQARAQGQKVFGETCPHYLLLSEDDLRRPNFEGAKYVLSPPLREGKHQQILWDSLSGDVLQTIATDHCPFNFKQHKELGRNDFTKIPNGAPGIENRLQLSYEFGVNQKRFSINRWVELNSTNPAKIFGMYPQKGEIAVGSDADIVIWNPDTQHTISAATHHMRVDYNLFEGFKVTGNAETVIARGEVIVEKNKFLGKPGRGKFIIRNPFSPNIIY